MTHYRIVVWAGWGPIKYLKNMRHTTPLVEEAAQYENVVDAQEDAEIIRQDSGLVVRVEPVE